MEAREQMRGRTFKNKCRGLGRQIEHRNAKKIHICINFNVMNIRE